MELQVIAANPNAKLSSWDLSMGVNIYIMNLEFDNKCPLCLNGFDMGSVQNHVHAFHNLQSEDDMECEVICVHRCPVCNRLFITRHITRRNDDIFSEVSHIVFPVENIQFDTYVEGLCKFSPRFYELYSSAIKLKNLGMDGIVGNTFRIALECLVKDYAKYLVPNDSSKIENYTLCDCIDKYFTSVPMTKALADAVRKIGNGYSHYVCKYSQDDIRNMQMFLETLCLYVYHELRIKDQLPLAQSYL